MKREYWNSLAASYEDEIFSVLENDRKKLPEAFPIAIGNLPFIPENAPLFGGI